MKPLAFVCMPRYSSVSDSRALRSLMFPGPVDLCIPPAALQTSVLTQAFNRLWVLALNTRRTHRITDFAMLHADVEPEDGWLPKMIAERNRVGADILSCVIPFKIMSGVTSANWPADEVNCREFHNPPPLPKVAVVGGQ